MSEIEIRPSSNTGGVKSFPIEGPMRCERYRVMKMTDEERVWRKQWLKDQILSPNEPRPLPANHYEANFNPIKRIYRWPLDTLFKPLAPILGQETAYKVRYITGKVLLFAGLVAWTSYYFKYNTEDWTRNRGFTLRKSKTVVLPGEPGYPAHEPKTALEYLSEYDRFDKSPI